jgi:hypothetical protein
VRKRFETDSKVLKLDKLTSARADAAAAPNGRLRDGPRGGLKRPIKLRDQYVGCQNVQMAGDNALDHATGLGYVLRYFEVSLVMWAYPSIVSDQL